MSTVEHTPQDHDSERASNSVRQQHAASSMRGIPTVTGLLLHLQRTAGNQAVNAVLRQYPAGRWVQRDDQADPSAGGQGQPDTPAGAPPDIQEDFDPAPDDDTIQPAPAVMQALFQRAVAPVSTIQRQDGGAAPSPPQVVAQSLQWSDFPVVPNRQKGMSAQTGFTQTWRNDGTGFNAVFNPATSWSVAADQTPSLLQHEQYHLNLAVLLANKANAVAVAGTMKAKSLIKEFKKAISTYTDAYDQDTTHGTNADLQGQWVAAIDAGKVDFPIT